MLKVLFPIVYLALAVLPTWAAQNNVKVEGSAEDIRWGHHWAGPEVSSAAAMKGKVTLLVIWGG